MSISFTFSYYVCVSIYSKSSSAFNSLCLSRFSYFLSMHICCLFLFFSFCHKACNYVSVPGMVSTHFIAHTDPLFAMTKLLKLDDLYKYQLGIFMHKVTHCQLPQNMSLMFLRTDNIHSHQLRNQNAYYIQQIRTNTRKAKINFSGPKFWNTLPANLRQLVSIHQFKKKFKALLVTKYS